MFYSESGAMKKYVALRQIIGGLRVANVCVRPSHLDRARRSGSVGQAVGADQRWGSSSLMRLAGCAGKRSSTSRR